MATINKSALQQVVTVVSNKRIGAYHQILLNVGDVVKSCRPGNFVAIRVGGESSKMILRRAFAISRVSDISQYGGTMELIVAPHGSGKFMQQKPWAGLSIALFKFLVVWVTAKNYPSSGITAMQGSTAFMTVQAKFTVALSQKRRSKRARAPSIHSNSPL